MTTISATRDDLVTDLQQTGTKVYGYVPEAIAAPCYVVQPSSPWLTDDDQPFCSYQVRWDVTAVVDVATNEVATDALDKLVQDALTYVQAAEVTEPYVYTSNTAMHLAADLTVITTITI